MTESPDPAGDTLAMSGRVLIKGPSGTGKTQALARALAAYTQQTGTAGVAVLDFAPQHKKDDGSLLGARVDHYLLIPPGVLHFVVPTRAPRASTSKPEDAIRIAKENAAACQKILHLLPDHVNALFVNDATIPFHVPGADARVLVDLIRSATIAVVTALDPVEFDPEHPITKQERLVLELLGRNTDQVFETRPAENQAETDQRKAETALRQHGVGGGPPQGGPRG